MDHLESIRTALLSDLTGVGRGLVTCLSGPWGSGKTYLWREIDASLRNEGKKTAYLSLFGVSNVADARSGIVNGLVLAEASPDTSKSQKAIIDLKAIGYKLAPWLVKYADSKLGFELLSKNLDLTRLIPRDAVVCLDDLERLSAQFRLEDALGFANLLAEQRGCRVLLIMNEAHIEERFPKEVAILKAYRERVVRRFLRVEADLPGVLPHILTAEKLTMSPEATSTVLATLLQAGCENIRTLIRALEHARDLAVVAGANLELDDVRLATALASEHSLGRLQDGSFYNFHPIVFAVRPRRGQVSETELAQQSFFTTYYGTSPYQFDPHIYALIKNGYLDAEAYVRARESKHRGPESRWEQLRARIDARDCLYLSDAEAALWIQESHEVFREAKLPAGHIPMIHSVAQFVGRSAGIELPADFSETAREALLGAARRGDHSLDGRTLTERDRGSLASAIEDYESELIRIATAEDRREILAAVRAHDEDAFRTTIYRKMPRSAEVAVEPEILSALDATLNDGRRFYFSCLSALAYIAKDIRSERLRDGLTEYLTMAIARRDSERGDKARLIEVRQDADFPSPPKVQPQTTQPSEPGTVLSTADGINNKA